MRANYTVLDFESFYSTEYSLRRMTPVEYILDARFECIGCAVLEGDDGHPFFCDEPQFRTYLGGKRNAQKQGQKWVVVSHNALFDMCLLVWRYGLVPDLMIDTMSMARAMVYAKTGSVSLHNVAQFLGLGAKGGTIGKVVGMNADAIKQAGLWDEYRAYATHDAVLCRAIFQKLRAEFPKDEFLWQDLVMRCAIIPRFQVDQELVAGHLHDVLQSKQELLVRTGLENRDALMSNDKFADALRVLGVEPPTKMSIKTGKLGYAFAKTDQAMAELEEHDDPDVQALIAARLGFKSTIEETRAQRFLTISQLTWPGKIGSGWMPVPLRNSGAHTHRLSGDWSLNMQNLRRGGKLRKSLRAPAGKVVITCDASQIEARLVAAIARCLVLIRAFAQGKDVYSLFASEHIYKREITKKTPKERFVGKQAVLGLGFGMGAPRYQTQVRKDSRLQIGEEIILSDEEAQNIVGAYRRGYPEIPEAWATLKNLLPILAREDSRIQFGPMTFGRQEIIGPTGLKLFYPNLQQVVTERGNEWQFKSGRQVKRLFGGKLYENIIQHLAGLCNRETALKMRKEYPRFPLAHQVHDELIYVVPETLADEFSHALETFMSESPAWAPDLPLAAETGVGPTYGDAK